MSDVTIEHARRMSVELRAIIQSEIEATRPPTRLAKVVSWDPNAHTAVVLYLGESEPVTLPYLGTAPSAVDQDVLVGGALNDRHVIDVKGQSGTEEGYDSYLVEDALGYADGLVTSNQSVSSTAWLTISFGGKYADPIGITQIAPGVYQVDERGMYVISAQFALASQNKIEFQMRILKTFASNGSTKVISYARQVVQGDDGDDERPKDYIAVLPHYLEALQPMKKGDTYELQVAVPSGLFSGFNLSTRGDCSILARRNGPIPE